MSTAVAEIHEEEVVDKELEGFTEEKFDYDDEFQSKIAALTLRDDEFLRRAAHILKPEFFENQGEACLVDIALQHFNKYGCSPDPASVVQIIKDKAASKVYKRETLAAIVEARKKLIGIYVTDKAFVEEKVVEFARKQAVSNAIVNSVPDLEAGNYAKIEARIKEAIAVGLNEEGVGYDFFAQALNRKLARIEKLTGKVPPTGITTGCKELDDLLYHRGWGRKELSLLMGGAKAGKTQALIHFGRIASFAKYNVLYVTLEVGKDIIADRLDDSISKVIMKELASKAARVATAVETVAKTAGKFIIHEFGSGTFSPSQLRALIDRYKNPGRNPDGTIRPPIKFDMIIVDYADLMRPDIRTNDPKENSRAIYVDLRAIAFEENVALLTATQTNREGFKSTVAKAEHVAEDFNKIRTADVAISINITEEERAKGQARLYFAASRNQEMGVTVVIKQNVSMMRFLEEVISVE